MDDLKTHGHHDETIYNLTYWIMEKRKATVSQPLVLRQKQLMQSILRFVPLREAALSAKVCKAWRNATKDGFIFHLKRLHFGKGRPKPPYYCLGDWGIYLVDSGFLNISEISEPRRSHILEICVTMTFEEQKWPQAIEKHTCHQI